MSPIFMDVNAYVGADIQDVAEDACRLSHQTGIDIWFDFHGVRLLANPGRLASNIVDEYHGKLEGKI